MENDQIRKEKLTSIIAKLGNPMEEQLLLNEGIMTLLERFAREDKEALKQRLADKENSRKKPE